MTRPDEGTVLSIEGPRILRPPRFDDDRGFFSECWSRERFRALGIDVDFVQDNHSFSRHRGTVRGLHFQTPPAAQAKLVRVARGAVFDVVVDLRRGSPSYGAWEGVELSATRWNQLFVPTGFAHGFCTLEPDTDVIYKVSTPYRPGSEGGVRWDDPRLGIPWPLPPEGPTITDRDRRWPALDELDSPFRFERPARPVSR